MVHDESNWALNTERCVHVGDGDISKMAPFMGRLLYCAVDIGKLSDPESEPACVLKLLEKLLRTAESERVDSCRSKRETHYSFLKSFETDTYIGDYVNRIFIQYVYNSLTKVADYRILADWLLGEAADPEVYFRKRFRVSVMPSGEVTSAVSTPQFDFNAGLGLEPADPSMTSYDYATLFDILHDAQESQEW